MEMIKLTTVEFEKIFSLHDSSIEKIDYDVENKKLNLEIDCCHWFENFDDKKNFISGKISVTFENVSLFEYEEHDFQNILENIDTEVVQTEINENDILEIIIREYKNFQPLEMDFWIIKIKAENVEVVELERYN